MGAVPPVFEETLSSPRTEFVILAVVSLAIAVALVAASAADGPQRYLAQGR